MKTMKRSQKVEIAIIIVIIAVVAFCIFFFQIRSNRSGTNEQNSVVYVAKEAAFVEVDEEDSETSLTEDEAGQAEE